MFLRYCVVKWSDLSLLSKGAYSFKSKDQDDAGISLILYFNWQAGKMAGKGHLRKDGKLSWFVLLALIILILQHILVVHFLYSLLWKANSCEQ